jgi:hypothetical protein
MPLMRQATTGKAVSGSFQPTLGPMEVERVDAAKETEGNSVALSCLNAAIDDAHVQRKVLASDLQMSEGYLSRLTSGAQACPLSLLDKLPDSIVLPCLDRIARARGARVMRDDEDVIAAEHLAEAAMRFVRVKVQMAKAGGVR